MGRRVALRPVVPADYERFYLVEMEPGNRLQRFRGTTIAPEDYPRQIWTGTLCQLTIADRRTGSALGLATAFSADLRNQHCRIAAFLLPEFRDEAWPIEGLGLFVEHLFRTFPFRKLYGDVLEPNAEQFASALGVVVREEGRLNEHEFLDGAYCALLTLAIYREDFFRESLAQRIRSEVRGDDAR